MKKVLQGENDIDDDEVIPLKNIKGFIPMD
jgi:hypothetical protein